MKKIFTLVCLILVSCSKNVEKTVNSPALPNNPLMPLEMILNGPLTAGGDVQEQFQNTPDGTKVVYIADESTNGDNELYVVDSDTKNKRKLQGVPSGRDVVYFIISPDSQRVAFLMDLTNAGMYDLYTININGTGLTQMNLGITNASRSVSRTFKFTPDSSKVVFVTDEVTGARNLYISNAISPVNRTQLNTAGMTPVSSVFEIAPNGSRVVYKEASNAAHPNIRSVQPNASGDIQLNPNFSLPASGASDFTVSPLSTKVVYRANQDNDAIYELYSVNIDGTGSVNKINGPIVTGGSVQPIQFKINNNGSKVVYIADQQIDEQFEIFVSNIDGTGNTKISGSMPASADVSDFKLSQDNLKVLFRANPNISSVSDLFVVSINGTGLVKVNSSLVSGENVGEYQTQGGKVAYAMDKGNVGVYSIYSANLDGSQETQLNTSITSGIGFYDPAQSSLTGTRQVGFGFDGSRIVMVGSYQGTNLDIFSVALDGTNFKKVNAQSGGNIVLNSTSDGSGFLTLPTKNYAVYRYNDGIKTQLYVGLIKE